MDSRRVWVAVTGALVLAGCATTNRGEQLRERFREHQRNVEQAAQQSLEEQWTVATTDPTPWALKQRLRLTPRLLEQGLRVEEVRRFASADVRSVPGLEGVDEELVRLAIGVADRVLQDEAAMRRLQCKGAELAYDLAFTCARQQAWPGARELLARVFARATPAQACEIVAEFDLRSPSPTVEMGAFPFETVAACRRATPAARPGPAPPPPAAAGPAGPGPTPASLHAGSEPPPLAPAAGEPVGSGLQLSGLFGGTAQGLSAAVALEYATSRFSLGVAPTLVAASGVFALQLPVLVRFYFAERRAGALTGYALALAGLDLLQSVLASSTGVLLGVSLGGEYLFTSHLGVTAGLGFQGVIPTDGSTGAAALRGEVGVVLHQ